MNPITLRYPFTPKRHSLAIGRLNDLFGLSSKEPSLTIAENLSLHLKPSDVVLFQGPSGSGKSTLLREVGRQLGALDARKLKWPKCSLIDALPGRFENRLDYLTSCGLGEPRLMLRTPRELSEGQAYRFRLAFALALAKVEKMATLQADEFASNLDRTLAKVLAYNVRRGARKHGMGFLLATAHTDLIEDLQPDVLVRCRGAGEVEVIYREAKPTDTISFVSEMTMVEGTKSD